jgi:hypothetical protein
MAVCVAVVKNTAIMACVAVACLSVGSAAAKDDGDARCIYQALPEKFVRVWDLDLGQTSLSKVGGLPCDKDWERISTDDQGSRTGVTNSIGDLLIEEVMDDLLAMGDNDNASAYYCPDGIRWYSVNTFNGCNLEDGKKFSLKGKTYENNDEDMSWVQSIKATVSYVCNKQARRRDIGVSYTAVVSSECRQ